MNDTEVFERVRALVAETFNCSVSDIDRTTTADDVSGWDSLSHTILMIRLQTALGIKIPEQTAAEAETVGELSDQLAEIVRQA